MTPETAEILRDFANVCGYGKEPQSIGIKI